jgi:hypothetical protein
MIKKHQKPYLTLHLYVISFVCAWPLLFSCKSSEKIDYKFEHISNSELSSKSSWFPFSSSAEPKQIASFQNRQSAISVNVLENVKDAFSNAKERELFYLKSVYQRSTPPYFGAFPAKEECAKEFLPVIFEELKNEEISLFGFATRGTDRGNYGACDKKVAKTSLIKTILECKKEKKIYNIEVSIEDANIDHPTLEKIYKSFRCI